MSSPEEDPVPRTLRRANDAAGTRNITKPAALFGEFWREGELALLFGAAGAGKSLLAVQIAESLARGRGADHEDGTRKPQAVLYVDLVLSDGQFALRYSRETRGGGRRVFKFSARLYRDRPAEGERLADWLRVVCCRTKNKRRGDRRPVGRDPQRRRHQRNFRTGA